MGKKTDFIAILMFLAGFIPDGDQPSLHPR